MPKRGVKLRTLTVALKEAIKQSGKSCYELSQETGVSQAQLSRFLNGERTITLETADKLAIALGLSLL